MNAMLQTALLTVEPAVAVFAVPNRVIRAVGQG